MIYELNIELFSGDQPVMRRLLVEDQTSFKQLHFIIQSSFDWSGLRPHIFLLHSSRETIAFSDRKDLNQPSLDFFKQWTILDEAKQYLSTWLKEEGDSFIYEYYQNSRFRRYLLVELAAVHEPEEGMIYPHCIEAEYLSPKECYQTRDNRFDYSYTSDNIYNLPAKINDFLLQEDVIISKPAIGAKDFYRDRLLKLAYQFFNKEAWRWISEDQIFSVVDYHSDMKLFLAVNGADGKEPGLSIFVGDPSFIAIQHAALEAQDTLPPQNLADFYGLGLLFKNANQLQASYRFDHPTLADILPAYSQDNYETYPYFFSIKEDASTSLNLSTKEMQWFILCLEQGLEVLALVKQGLELPSIRHSDSLLARQYSKIDQTFVNEEIRMIK